MKRLILLLLFFAALAFGQAKVRIQDVIEYADGWRPNGKITLQWTAFTTSGLYIPGGRTVVTVRRGVVDLWLWPNSSTGYRATYSLSDSTVYSETWYVPNGPGPYTIAQLISPSGGVPATWDDITGNWDTWAGNWDTWTQ